MIAREYNIETGETTERPLTQEEIAEIEATSLETQAERAKTEAEQQKRDAVLAALAAAAGLEVDEVKAALGA